MTPTHMLLNLNDYNYILYQLNFQYKYKKNVLKYIIA